MMLQVYSVYDKAVNAFLQPFYARSAGEAIRSFGQLASDPETNVSRHPTDFVLYGLGAFHDGSGLFETSEPIRMISASEWLQQASLELDAGIAAAQARRGANGAA